MNKNLNLVEILKDAPKRTKLYSPICGECEFVGIGDYSSPIKCEALEDNCLWKFRSDGTFAIYKDAECLLFPSKENRDWSTFKMPKPHKHFKPFQKVLCMAIDDNHDRVWAADFYSYYDKYKKQHYLVSGYIRDEEGVIPYESNEDKLGKLVEQF